MAPGFSRSTSTLSVTPKEVDRDHVAIIEIRPGDHRVECPDCGLDVWRSARGGICLSARTMVSVGGKNYALVHELECGT